MYNLRPSPIRATLATDTPLLAAGLRRAVHRLDFEEVSDVDAADLAVRTVGSGTRHPELDIECDDHRVVLTLTERPPAELWSAVLELLEQLLQS